MKVHQVNPQYIASMWPKVGPMLHSALITGGGEYNADQLKVFLTEGKQMLFVAEEDGDIKGACAVALNSYPNALVGFVTAIGGRLLSTQENIEQFMSHLKAIGCTEIRGAGDESIMRLWRIKFGAEHLYNVFRIAI